MYLDPLNGPNKHDDRIRQREKLVSLRPTILTAFYAETIIGVGTGSTANCFIDALAPNRHRFEAAVASSEATAERLRSHGIPVASLNDAGLLSIYVDGADEIDASFNMIKGGGAALTRKNRRGCVNHLCLYCRRV